MTPPSPSPPLLGVPRPCGRAPRRVMELWEPARVPRRDRTGQCPARRQMGISARAKKKHQQAPRTVFVADLFAAKEKSRFQHRNRGYPAARALPQHRGLGRGEESERQPGRREPCQGAHRAPQPITLAPGHPPHPSSGRNRQTKFPTGGQREPGDIAVRKSQQRSRLLLRIGRQSHTCSTSRETKIHPNANSGL